jgi:hypothetical protein
MKHTKDVTDDDGNIIPPPAPDHPVMAVLYLLHHARKHGFQIGPAVQVGDTIVQVSDLRQEAQKQSGSRRPELDPDSDMAKILNG